jgi:Outer membrane protein beta-barrel domain
MIKTPAYRGLPALFLALLPVCCLAQSPRTSWSAGIRTGVTLAGVNRSAIRSFSGVSLTDVSVEAIQTAHVGVMVNRQLSPRFSLQSEINYNRYGGKLGGDYKLGSLTGRADVDVRIGTIEIPLLIKTTIGRGRVRGFVNLGGSVAYTVNNTVTTSTALLNSLIPDLNRKLIYGLTGGAGVSLGLGPGRIFLEGRYSYSLGDNLKLDFGGGQLHYQIGTGSVGYLVSF